MDDNKKIIVLLERKVKIEISDSHTVELFPGEEIEISDNIISLKNKMPMG